MSEDASERGESFTAERLGAFSDGVLAIVVTILVLDIRIPKNELSLQTLPQFLGDVEHDIIVYAASFWLVGAYWMLHHFIVGFVRYVNQRILLINLLFLFAASLLPFLTKLKNAFPNAPVAAHCLALGHLGCGLALLALWRYLCRNPSLLRKVVEPKRATHLTRGIYLGCTVAVLAATASHLSARISTYLLPAVPFVYTAALLRSGHTRPEARLKAA